MKYSYEERYCPNCRRDTLQYCRDSDHERDASADYQECLYCNWQRSGWGPYEGRVEQRIEFKWPFCEFAVYSFRTFFIDLPGNWDRIGVGNHCESIYNLYRDKSKPRMLIRHTSGLKWPRIMTHQYMKEMGVSVMFLEEEYSNYII